ncbi:hypothetical protein C6Q28_00050 [Burkholderia multivorans]|nr:hypothetical protein C6Q28_00050 [Burkholderia multivorans]
MHRVRRVSGVGRVGRIVHMKRNNRVRIRTKRALFYPRVPQTPRRRVAPKPRNRSRTCIAAPAVAGLPS